MKKILFLSIVFALMLAGCATALTPAPAQPTAMSTAEYIETRGIAVAPDMASGIQVQVLSAPEPNAEVLTTLNPGQEVEVIGYDGTGVWLVIKLDDGTIGWIPLAYVAATLEN